MLNLDPYAILGVRSSDSKAAILKAVAKRMEEKKLDLKTIVECQKVLFDPEKSAAAKFLYSIDDLSILDDAPPSNE